METRLRRVEKRRERRGGREEEFDNVLQQAIGFNSAGVLILECSKANGDAMLVENK